MSDRLVAGLGAVVVGTLVAGVSIALARDTTSPMTDRDRGLAVTALLAASGAEELARVSHGKYTRFATELADQGLHVPPQVTLAVFTDEAGTTYCVEARLPSGRLNLRSSDHKFRTGGCR